ncbi:MAG TPA: hypothetical protein VFQ70_01665 [Candidatus Saccharimonadaceae bacterium]|nr:hypothetical protein [Candidatus Saccharimonadaceae bacterium]
MIIVGIIGWWYGRGLESQLERLLGHIVGVYDYFSIGLLARTLFAPFRQISAGQVRGSLAVQLHALGDRMFSRLVGAVVRLITMIIGVIACVVVIVGTVVGLVFWLVMPLAPVIGVVFLVAGWVPWHL